MDIEKLQINDKTNERSSSNFNKTPEKPAQSGNIQDGRSREEIKMERRAKAAKAKTRKSSFSVFSIH